jgi:hypothetical protein
VIFQFNGFDFSDCREAGKISAQDLLLFFKVKSEKDLEFVSCYLEFRDCLNKIEKISSSFRQFNLNHEDYDPDDYVPSFMWSRLRKLRDDVWIEALEYFRSQVGKENFDKICSFFLNFKSEVINKLESEILVNNGTAIISFLFSENFRFKSAPDCLNVFNLQKEFRDVLIPQNENSIIFAPDFRQFEFRTFLNIQGIDSYFSHEQIYEEIGKNLNIANPKEGIISYLYGSNNQKFEDFFKKKTLIERIEDQVFWFGEIPVFIRDDYDVGKKVHTIMQTVSQFFYIEKLNTILDFLADKKSKFLYPHHDCMIFSLDASEPEVVDFLIDCMETEVYKVKCYAGSNYRDILEIK